jgi:hypothetical protein
MHGSASSDFESGYEFEYGLNLNMRYESEIWDMNLRSESEIGDLNLNPRYGSEKSTHA